MAIYRGSGGSTSTTDQATIDQVAEDAATATTKATEAANSATAAATSASSASTSATSAATSATSASTSASSAATSASNASTSASSASSSATAAAASATAADASNTNAAAEAAAALSSKALALDAQTAAETAESNASDHADDAVKAAYGAEDVLQTLSDTSTIYSARHYQIKAAASESSVAADASTASAAATAASASETAAAASETAAAASETAAGLSETAAAASETAAAASATAAAASETAALASETAAAASETAAAASETAAAASETAAASSASAASTSETNAAASETAAASSASAAQAAEDAALAALDSFDDRYLGQKASDPTLDNDGDALVAGALYFNTTDNAMKVYDGSNWLAAYASLSGALIAANNLSDLVSASAARTNLGLGTAATTASTDYATAAQGATADSALQDITGESIEDLSDVAAMTPTDGQLLTWNSVTSKWNAEDAPVSLPDQTGASGYYLTTNGTSASWDALATVANSGAYSDLSGTPTNVSTFTNDSGYLTGNQTITLSGDVSGSGTTSISVTVADDSHNHVISNVDGLQTALDGKQPLATVLTNTTASFTTAQETKLSGIESGATADQTASEILTAIKTVDGSGSGLDADTVDGVQESSFLRADASRTLSGVVLTCSNDAGIDVTNTSQINGLQVYQPTSNADALMTFHVAGDFACHFGLDGDTNDLTVGGWSMGANKYKVWHAGNDGSGSGLDADTLDGVQGSSYLSQGGSISSGTVTTLTSTTANITTVDLGNWTVTESAGVLYFATSGVNKMKLDASGNLTVVGDVTAYGTI